MSYTDARIFHLTFSSIHTFHPTYPISFDMHTHTHASTHTRKIAIRHRMRKQKKKQIIERIDL